MGRLIDADALDAAFTALRFNDDGSLKHWGDRPDWCLHGNEVETLIKDAPTVEPKMVWISVKDRLPKSMANKVLVWLKHNDLVGCIGFGHYEKYKGQEIWFDLEGNAAFSVKGYTVTHWMPIPEPPKEEDYETY